MKVFNTIQFKAIPLPTFKEVRGKDWVAYGEDNMWPQKMIELYQSSAMHATAIKAKKDGVCGEGIIAYGDRIVNLQQESLDEVFSKATLDYLLFGGFSLNLIWNRAGDKIAEIYHLPFDKVRSGKQNEQDEVEYYYFSSNWGNTRKYKPLEYKKYDPTDNKGDNASQIYYCFDYSPGNDVYPLPSYQSAVNDIELDGRISIFHASHIDNGMFPGIFINLPNGMANDEERRAIYRDLERSFSGAENSGKLFLSFSDGPDRAPQVTTVPAANDDYLILLDQRISARILSSHRLSSPLLLGIKDASGFSNNADEIETAYGHFMGTVIDPIQKFMTKNFEYILRSFGLNVKLDIEPNQIIYKREVIVPQTGGPTPPPII